MTSGTSYYSDVSKPDATPRLSHTHHGWLCQFSLDHACRQIADMVHARRIGLPARTSRRGVAAHNLPQPHATSWRRRKITLTAGPAKCLTERCRIPTRCITDHANVNLPPQWRALHMTLPPPHADATMRAARSRQAARQHAAGCGIGGMRGR